ncbi:MAG TPA: DPP IV N-terminal domain-containing protein, partial [Kofleriaceae bacterium]|nr:DPP IV N-terminal domain-containing protein [Kofleriaceae bacterium]
PAPASVPVLAPAPPPPPIDEQAIVDMAATRNYSLGTPKPVALLADGDVLFLRTGPRSLVAELFELDADTKQIRKLASAADLARADDVKLSAAEKARRERTRTSIRGIVSVQASDDGKTLLIPLGAQVFLLDRATGASRALDLGDGYPDDPRLSPDGRRVAFLRDDDVWIADVAGGKPRRLTTKDGPAVSNGSAEFVSQEELDRTRGTWWSPDSAQLLYQHTDESKVDTLYVADPAHPDQAPTPFRYPRAGTTNADVKLGLVPAAGGRTTWIDWDRAAFPYIHDVQWREHAPPSLVVLDRAQTVERLLSVDVKTGKTKVLLEEKDPAWVDPTEPTWATDGKSFLWSSEHDGAWHLDRYAPDGTHLEELTRSTEAFDLGYQVDGDNGDIWVVGSSDPTQAAVASLNPVSKVVERLTDGDGVHNVLMARHGGTRVLISQGADGTRAWHAVRANGELIAELPSVAEDPPRLPDVKPEQVDVDGRVHYAAVVRPRDFDPHKRYPVILQVYAGPTITTVWDLPQAYLRYQLVADTGFIVVLADGRGTPRRGHDWERVIKGDLITIPLEDQVDILKALGAAHPELDLDRVGVTGWSFGGYFSVMAVLLRPDVFKAAIAGAPVTDWRYYDTAYTERYMGLPQEHAAAYDATSAVVNAGKLTRPLLLVHGLTDDNVYIANTLALTDALTRAGKPFELIPLGGTHMMADPTADAALLDREIRFFREHLGLPAPR